LASSGKKRAFFAGSAALYALTLQTPNLDLAGSPLDTPLISMSLPFNSSKSGEVSG
jgi:hypothetical protein